MGRGLPCQNMARRVRSCRITSGVARRKTGLASIACGIVATPFTMLIGIVVGTFTTLSEGQNEDRDGDKWGPREGYSKQLPLRKWVNGFSWGPLVWGWAVTATLWTRLANHLSSASQDNDTRQASDNWPSEMFGMSYSMSKKSRIQKTSVNTMLAITCVVDAIMLPIGLVLQWW
jgi:hypothetical protein